MKNNIKVSYNLKIKRAFDKIIKIFMIQRMSCFLEGREQSASTIICITLHKLAIHIFSSGSYLICILIHMPVHLF